MNSHSTFSYCWTHSWPHLQGGGELFNFLKKLDFTTSRFMNLSLLSNWQRIKKIKLYANKMNAGKFWRSMGASNMKRLRGERIFQKPRNIEATLCTKLLITPELEGVLVCRFWRRNFCYSYIISLQSRTIKIHVDNIVCWNLRLDYNHITLQIPCFGGNWNTLSKKWAISQWPIIFLKNGHQAYLPCCIRFLVSGLIFSQFSWFKL